jgi:MFS family permease
MKPAEPADRWAMVALLSIAAVVAYMDRLILSVLFVPLASDLHLTDTQVSVLQGGSFAFIYALAGVPLGLLADRMKRRNIIIASITVWCGATIASGFAATFAQLMLARFCTGIGEAALFPAATSMIGDGVGLRRRGLALGLFVMGQMLGGGAAVAVGGVLLDLAQAHSFDAIPILDGLPPWGMVLVIVGSPGVLLLLGLSFLREPTRRETAIELTSGHAVERAPGGAVERAHGRAVERTPGHAAVDLAHGRAVESNATRSVGLRMVFVELAARRKVVLPLYLVLACAAISDFSIGSWTPTLLTRNFGWSGTQIALWFGGCLILSGIVAALLAGLISDWARGRRGRNGVLHVALAAAVAALVCTSFALMPNPRLLIGVLFFQSIASSTCSLICVIAIQVSLPNELRGLGSGILSLGNMLLGLGCGPTLVALATDHLYHSPSAVGLSIVTVIAPAFVACVLLLLSAAPLSAAEPRVERHLG